MCALNFGRAIEICCCSRDFQKFMERTRRHRPRVVERFQKGRVFRAERTIGFDLCGRHLGVKVNAASLEATLLNIADALHSSLHDGVFFGTFLLLQRGEGNGLRLRTEVNAVKERL